MGVRERGAGLLELGEKATRHGDVEPVQVGGQRLGDVATPTGLRGERRHDPNGEFQFYWLNWLYWLNWRGLGLAVHLAFIGIGCANFVAGRYGRSARWAQAGVEAYPDSFWASRVVAAAATHAGARADGRRVVGRLLRKDPSLTVSVARRAWPFPPPVMGRLADGLAKAGLPRD